MTQAIGDLIFFLTKNLKKCWFREKFNSALETFCSFHQHLYKSEHKHIEWNSKNSLYLIEYTIFASYKLHEYYGNMLALVYKYWRCGNERPTPLQPLPALSSSQRTASLAPLHWRSPWSLGRIPAWLCDSSWGHGCPLYLLRPQSLLRFRHFYPTGWRSHSDLHGLSEGGKSVGLSQRAPGAGRTGRLLAQGRL